MFLSRRNTNSIGDNMQTTTQTKPVTVMAVTQAAEYLGLAVSTLNKWRCHGGGPVFIKMGRAVRYRVEYLECYLSDSSTTITTEYA